MYIISQPQKRIRCPADFLRVTSEIEVDCCSIGEGGEGVKLGWITGDGGGCRLEGFGCAMRGSGVRAEAGGKLGGTSSLIEYVSSQEWIEAGLENIRVELGKCDYRNVDLGCLKGYMVTLKYTSLLTNRVKCCIVYTLFESLSNPWRLQEWL